jgi:STAS domain
METTRTEPVLTCDLGALTAPDLAVVDALARLRLAAARHRVGVLLLNASGPLRELLAFSGLEDLLPVAPDPGPPLRLLLGEEAGREAEQREEHLGVEEVGDRGDPAL